MSQTGTSMKQQKHDASATRVDMKLEVDIIPVSNVERSKLFVASVVLRSVWNGLSSLL